MRAGDVKDLLRVLWLLSEGTLVLVASYNDPATKLMEESRRIFGELGSAVAKDLGFRDSWVFVGAEGVQDRSPFEQEGGISGGLEHIRNSCSSNKYEGWPEALELRGCVPRRPPGGPQNRGGTPKTPRTQNPLEDPKTTQDPPKMSPNKGGDGSGVFGGFWGPAL
ncbi:protein FAM3A-like [Oenanthe melanoleuca]|uniref:protein FAM3A-like n=1 Tax=Oenanthe melanoleuca TaxID=2939378 RepID=UPI0024C1302D|nr:protein FAM3A-like [Oenanthe melanoleuca]